MATETLLSPEGEWVVSRQSTAGADFEVFSAGGKVWGGGSVLSVMISFAMRYFALKACFVLGCLMLFKECYIK